MVARRGGIVHDTKDMVLLKESQLRPFLILPSFHAIADW